MRKLVGVTLALMCLLLPSGCGGNGEVTLEGEVTYDGKPVPAGAISFLVSDAKGGGSGGGTILDGKYRVTSEAGLKPGTYRVEIRWAKPTGKKMKTEANEMLDITEEGLPEKYNTKSELTKEVKSGSNKIDFHLPK